jgi:hypothetical protein
MSRGKADLLSRCSPTLEVALGDGKRNTLALREIVVIVESHLLGSTSRTITLDHEGVAEGLDTHREAATLLVHGDVKLTNLEEGNFGDAHDSTLRRGDKTFTVNIDVLNFVHVYIILSREGFVKC